MKKFLAALLGAGILSAALLSAAAPAFALGGCGPNGHRNAWGYCVFGGQKSGLVSQNDRPSSHAHAQRHAPLFQVSGAGRRIVVG